MNSTTVHKSEKAAEEPNVYRWVGKKWTKTHMHWGEVRKQFVQREIKNWKVWVSAQILPKLLFDVV